MSSPVALLPSATALTGAELLYGVQNRGDVQLTTGQIKSFIASGGAERILLQGNTNFYVSTTGSDSFDGSSPTHLVGTLQGPWATLQHADDTIALTIDFNSFNITVNVAAGSYVGIENISGYFSSAGNINSFITLLYQGDTVTPSNVKIIPTAFREIGYGIFAPNFSIVGPVLAGFDFIALGGIGANTDTAVWVENFYVHNLAGASVQNCQFDAAGSAVPLLSGNVSISGNIFVNGAAAGWSGSSCTAIQNDGNEQDLGNSFFSTATITIAGNPSIQFAFNLIQAGSCFFGGGGTISGAYVGGPFQVTDHSRLVSPFVGWSSSHFGTPSAKPVIADGGLFVVVTASSGLEATGGQIIGIGNNYSQPVTGFTLNIGQYDGTVVIDPAGTLSTGTIVMPSPALNGQRISIRSSQIITTLTVSPGSSQSVVGAPTTIAAGGVLDALYKDSNSTWYF